MAPANAGFQLSLGSVYHRGGRLDEARKSYEKAIKLQPDLAPAYYNLGLLERSHGNTARGQKLIARARELDPSLPAR